MKLRDGMLVLGLLAIFVAGASAEEKAASSTFMLDGKAIELARYAKAYVGQGNVTVEVAPYKWEENNRAGAILLIKGVEGPWDGKAINHKIRSSQFDGSTEYMTSYEGKDWTTLMTGRGADKKNFLFVPEVREEISLAPSDGAAQLTSPQAIFQEYQRQHGKKEGVPK